MSSELRPAAISHLAAAIVVYALVVGCSGRPSAVSRLNLDPESAANKAFDEYDQDSDGHLSRSELAGVPSLISAWARFDRNSDDAISREEMSGRFREWVESASLVTTVPVRVWLDGKPLDEAEIVFEPESFLADAIPPATGTTASGGHVTPGMPKDQLPGHLANVNAMRLGLYRVKITHPDRTIPARYNDQTTQGIEIHLGTQAGITEFRLTSK